MCRQYVLTTLPVQAQRGSWSWQFKSPLKFLNPSKRGFASYWNMIVKVGLNVGLNAGFLVALGSVGSQHHVWSTIYGRSTWYSGRPCLLLPDSLAPTSHWTSLFANACVAVSLNWLCWLKCSRFVPLCYYNVNPRSSRRLQWVCQVSFILVVLIHSGFHLYALIDCLLIGLSTLVCYTVKLLLYS